MAFAFWKCIANVYLLIIRRNNTLISWSNQAEKDGKGADHSYVQIIRAEDEFERDDMRC